MGEQGFYKLVSRHEVIKAAKRDRVLDTRVVGVKGDDVGDTHGDQLLERHSAV